MEKVIPYSKSFKCKCIYELYKYMKNQAVYIYVLVGYVPKLRYREPKNSYLYISPNRSSVTILHIVFMDG